MHLSYRWIKNQKEVSELVAVDGEMAGERGGEQECMGSNTDVKRLVEGIGDERGKNNGRHRIRRAAVLKKWVRRAAE